MGSNDYWLTKLNDFLLQQYFKELCKVSPGFLGISRWHYILGFQHVHHEGSRVDNDAINIVCHFTTRRSNIKCFPNLIWISNVVCVEFIRERWTLTCYCILILPA